MREFVVAGLLISLAVFLPLRWVLVRLRFDRWFWHPLLAEAAIYLCILATLNLIG